MDELELLKAWPGWAKANAESVLESPAWRMAVEWQGDSAVLTRSVEISADSIGLDVTFEDEVFRLAIADTEAYPDLHRLWTRRGELPAELVLALVEKECGPLFQLLENTFRRQFAVKGLSTEAAGDELTAFRLTAGDVELSFALALSPVLKAELGQLRNIDTTHETVAEMKRSMVADYGALSLSADELAGLKPGDFILQPEASARWVFASEPEEGCRLRGGEAVEFTFAEIAEERLPSVPEPQAVQVVADGRTVARGEMVTTGLCSAMRVAFVC